MITKYTNIKKQFTINNIIPSIRIYTAASKNEKSVSELSKLLRGEKVDNSKSNSEDAGMSMDKVIISKEALERLQAMNMA